MLAAKKPMSRGRASKGGASRFAADAARRVGGFVLARPGTIALGLLFGGLALAVSTNALWMQSAQHPAPLFRQAALPTQHPTPPRKAPEEQAAPSLPAAEGAGAMLPPARPAGIGKPVEASASPAAAPKPVAGKHAKDPI